MSGMSGIYITLTASLSGKACGAGHRVRNALDVLLESGKGGAWHAHFWGACEPGGVSPQLPPLITAPGAASLTMSYWG
ncbi:hypothetical protein GCM10010250_26960 [Streptomyces althioticus]|nr:hypothetical protein GCM10010250_26960 [Streptomyces althioticus]GGT59794.1 hypothetical protein GCM10010243_42810 [Streptomyces matensis]